MPTELTEYADHTFVYCPDNKKYFVCWGGGNIDGKDTVKICSGKYKNAYAVANCYRRDVKAKKPLKSGKDTAGIGTYGYNGVCHQSANSFLYAAGTLLKLKNWRPSGLPASVAAYGLHGTDAPFTIAAEATHWTWWWWKVYRPCKDKVDKLSEAFDTLIMQSDDEMFRDVHMRYKELLAQDPSKPLENIDVKISDLAVLIKHAAPEVDLEAVADIQRSYLQEHEGLTLAEMVDLPTDSVINEQSAERINALSEQFQKALAEKIGAEAYKKLTGLEAGQTIKLVDPRIIEEVKRSQ